MAFPHTSFQGPMFKGALQGCPCFGFQWSLPLLLKHYGALQQPVWPRFVCIGTMPTAFTVTAALSVQFKTGSLFTQFCSLGLSVWHRESRLYPICFWMRNCKICMVTHRHHWCTYNTPHKTKKHSSCVWAKLGFALIRTVNEWKCILPQDLEHYIHYFVVLLVFFCVCARACVVINSCKYITSKKKNLVCFPLPSCCLPSGSEQYFFLFLWIWRPPGSNEINGWKATTPGLTHLH